MFGADVVVVQVASLFHRVLDHLFGSRRLGKLAHRDHIWSRLNDLFDFDADLAEINFQVLQHVSGDAGTFFDQAKQDVFGTDVLVVEPLRFLIRELHHFASAVSKSFVHFLPHSFPDHQPFLAGVRYCCNRVDAAV